jgi:putative membrane protein
MNAPNSELKGLDARTILANHRTGLAFENTLTSADRTQMSVLRTSLSLIGFGFTIFKFFQEIGKSQGRTEAFGPAARNLSIALVVLGLGLLITGICNRRSIMRSLADRRKVLYEQGLLRTPPSYSTSPNMVASVLMITAGLLVLLGILTRIGPFG